VVSHFGVADRTRGPLPSLSLEQSRLQEDTHHPGQGEQD
jgi:hypothetical protein